VTRSSKGVYEAEQATYLCTDELNPPSYGLSWSKQCAPLPAPTTSSWPAGCCSPSDGARGGPRSRLASLDQRGPRGVNLKSSTAEDH
jgi:hypothetical protein